MIRYPDGSVKNLTRLAGYGTTGLQGRKGTTSIAVREPCVHWSGNRAVFSMVVGAPRSQYDESQFFWQLYEISGLGKNETPVISKVPNQPENFNNISPIYASDDRIIFVSDRTNDGTKDVYPTLDEANADPTNTGLWSLDPATGDLQHLDHSPSGDFSPTLDSYGRIIFTRWDHFTHDQDSLQDASSTQLYPFNYDNEAAASTYNLNANAQIAPEASPFNSALLKTSTTNPHPFTFFMPWMIDQSGAGALTLNHLGRHDLADTINSTFRDDPNLVPFSAKTSTRSNKNIVLNAFSIKEDPQHPGSYYAVDAPIPGNTGGYNPSNITHTAGQIVRIDAPETARPEDVVVQYITPRSTRQPLAAAIDTATHTGFYRNPLPTTDGKLIVSHTSQQFGDINMGVDTVVKPKMDMRLQLMEPLEPNSTQMKATANLTGGITTVVQWYQNGKTMNFSGTLWELDPVEVVHKPAPTAHISAVADVEKQVFDDVGVPVSAFQAYLKDNNSALLVVRDVTDRNSADKQQPFNIRVASSKHQLHSDIGKLYDVQSVQFMEASRTRGYYRKLTAQNYVVDGRRNVPQPLSSIPYAAVASGAKGSVNIDRDGSFAAILPAGQALNWQLNDPQANAVVRERYWVTFAAGEIRTCASCHGSNPESPLVQASCPQNKALALNGLLTKWKADYTPAQAVLSSPQNNSMEQSFPLHLEWQESEGAKRYLVIVQGVVNNAATTLYTTMVSGTSITLKQSDLAQAPRILSWQVQAMSDYLPGTVSETWTLSTKPTETLQSPANLSKNLSTEPLLQWSAISDVDAYHVQISTSADFSSVVVDDNAVTDTHIQLSALSTNTTYYWRVKALWSGGESAWSTAWSFSTHDINTLASCQLILPLNNATDLQKQVTMQWSPVSDATQYTIELSELADFAASESHVCFSPQWTGSGLKEHTSYYWRVRAERNTVLAPWSEEWSFTTASDAVSSVDELTDPAGLLLFPQPSSESVQLRFAQCPGGVCDLSIRDVEGRLVRTESMISPSGPVEYSMNLQDIPSGTYGLELRWADKRIVRMLSVVK